MLEFYADASLSYYKPEFNKEKRIILYCASSGRSALAVKTLKEMGYTNVAHIDGGLKAREAAGLAGREVILIPPFMNRKKCCFLKQVLRP
jgi:rhodanese-related sulfurtransferase